MMDDIKLVIFDCDGVLIDSEFLALRSLVETLAEFGVSMDMHEAAARYAGRSISSTADVEARYNVKLPPEYLMRKRQRRDEMFRTQLRTLPDIGALISALPCKKCVASGSSLSRLGQTLASTDIWPLLSPHIFSAEQVAHGKPAPDLFLFAAEQMGVAPQECLVIEDSHAGMQAARAANMRAFGYIGGAHCPEGHAQTLLNGGAMRVFSDHADIAKALGLSLA